MNPEKRITRVIELVKKHAALSVEISALTSIVSSWRGCDNYSEPEPEIGDGGSGTCIALTYMQPVEQRDWADVCERCRSILAARDERAELRTKRFAVARALTRHGLALGAEVGK